MTSPIGGPFTCITVEMVHKALPELDPTKSSGCPILSAKFYLDLLTNLTEQLAFLYNLCLKTQKIPWQWKMGIVTPLPKKGNITLLDNLRPITTTHVVGEILEKFVASFIQSHLDHHQIICPNQKGFRKGFSTTDAATDLNYSMNDNSYSICLFLDLKKAFHSVSHSILLRNLLDYINPSVIGSRTTCQNVNN